MFMDEDGWYTNQKGVYMNIFEVQEFMAEEDRKGMENMYSVL